MKKLKNIVLFFVICLFLPLGLFACDDKTLDDIAWTPVGYSQNIISDCISNKNYAVMSNVPVEYRTVTIYNFHETARGEVEDRKIVDETHIILSQESSPTATAKIVTTRKIDDVNKYRETYVFDKAKMVYYATRETFGETGKMDTADAKILYDVNDYTLQFADLFETYVPNFTVNEVNYIAEKDFNKIHYYKLSADVQGLNVIKAKFRENEDIYNNPSFFQMLDANNLPKDFDYQLGFNDAKYLCYFAMNYSVENNNMVNEKFETYLEVNTVTELLNYTASKVQKPSLPEDKDIYIASHFRNVMVLDENYICYEQTDAQGNVTTTEVFKTLSTYYVKQTIDGTAPTVNYYKIDASGEQPDVYILSGSAFVEDTEYTPFFLQFNYAPDISKGAGADAEYNFGNTDNFTKIKLVNGKISSASLNGRVGSTVTIKDFSATIPNELSELQEI